MNKAYERETEMWNQVFKECTPVDLRTLYLQVETMFDDALKLFAQKTTIVLDFGCGKSYLTFAMYYYLKELKGYEKLFLKAGESKNVRFKITPEMLRFYNYDIEYVYEPGEFDVMIGSNSRDVLTKRFILR